MKLQMPRWLTGEPPLASAAVHEETPDIGSFAYSGPRPETGQAMGELERLFWGNTGRVAHKWHHYLPLYERYFAPYRDRPVRMLEIGVFKGGSLDLWRRFFGPELILFGIDVDPACARFDGQSAQVRIGSQDDPDFLRRVVAEMGGIDIVLDDGSHQSPHIRASLDVLFPLLNPGGIYMIEDLHAAYWTDFGGGYDAPEGFMQTVKVLVDDLHHWYHTRGQKIAATADHLAAMHMHDSILILEKQAVGRPMHTQVGQADPTGHA